MYQQLFMERMKLGSKAAWREDLGTEEFTDEEHSPSVILTICQGQLGKGSSVSYLRL